MHLLTQCVFIFGQEKKSTLKKYEKGHFWQANKIFLSPFDHADFHGLSNIFQGMFWRISCISRVCLFGQGKASTTKMNKKGHWACATSQPHMESRKVNARWRYCVATTRPYMQQYLLDLDPFSSMISWHKSYFVHVNFACLDQTTADFGGREKFSLMPSHSFMLCPARMFPKNNQKLSAQLYSTNCVSKSCLDTATNLRVETW